MTSPQPGPTLLAARETLAEALSWTSGEMTRWFDHAVADHNRWSWRGDGHGPGFRQQFYDQADALLASGVLHDVTGLADDETLMRAAILAIQEVDDEAPYICAGEADQARAVLRSVETVLGGAE